VGAETKKPQKNGFSKSETLKLITETNRGPTSVVVGADLN